LKTIYHSLSILAVSALAAQAQLLSGNLAVLRIGDGSATLGSSSTAGFIEQYTTAGAFVNTVAIPSTGASALTWSGSATSEGALTLSPDGSLLTMAGYNTAAGLASVAGSSGSSVARGVATVNLAGTYNLAATTTKFSKNNVRGGVSDGAGNYWAVGATDGTRYLGTAHPTAQVQNTIDNARVINIVNGNLYFSVGSGSGLTKGIYSISGTPYGAATASLVLGTGSSSSPFAFALDPSGAIMYIADDTTSSTGGIEKWTLSGGVWSLSYTLGTGVTGVGARGLAVDFSSATPVLFATTSETSGANRIIEITDTDANALAQTLATSGQNEVFRGLVLVPEPGGILGLGLVMLLVARRVRRPSN
jgi:hypothetical protein